MTLAVGERNKAGSLNLHLGDADCTSHSYTFSLRTLKPNLRQQVVADYGASLAEPLKVEKEGTTPGLGPIHSLLVIGDWSDKPVDVVLSGIALVPPTAELRARQESSGKSRPGRPNRLAKRPRLRRRRGKTCWKKVRNIRRTARRSRTSSPWRRTLSPSPCRLGNTLAINSCPMLPNPATRLSKRRRTSRGTR